MKAVVLAQGQPVVPGPGSRRRTVLRDSISSACDQPVEMHTAATEMSETRRPTGVTG